MNIPIYITTAIGAGFPLHFIYNLLSPLVENKIEDFKLTMHVGIIGDFLLVDEDFSETHFVDEFEYSNSYSIIFHPLPHVLLIFPLVRRHTEQSVINVDFFRRSMMITSAIKKIWKRKMFEHCMFNIEKFTKYAVIRCLPLQSLIGLRVSIIYLALRIRREMMNCYL